MPQNLLPTAIHARGTGSSRQRPQAAILRDYYRADDWASVEQYWETHPASVQELADAIPGVRAFFAGSPVSLRVQSSPDGDGPPTLFASVEVRGDDAEGFRRMRQFDQWCIEHLPLDFSVVFDVEFA